MRTFLFFKTTNLLLKFNLIIFIISIIASTNFIHAQFSDSFFKYSDNVISPTPNNVLVTKSGVDINPVIGNQTHRSTNQLNGFCDGFESGSYSPIWQAGTGDYIRSVNNIDPAVGAYSFQNSSSSSQSFYQGTFTTFTPFQPTQISWYAKTNNTTGANGYFVAGDGNIASDNGIFFCYFNSTGDLRFFNTSGYNHPITANTWYHIEVKNIDYINRNMDIYVNNVLILENWAFRSPTATTFDRVHLLNLVPSVANYDHIEFGEGACTTTSCPVLTTAPPNVTIINSVCGSNCTRSGGSITTHASPCPSGSTLEYNVNGTGWTSTLPMYVQNGPVQTITTRCNCNTDNTLSSPSSTPVTTSPGACTGNCDFVHNSGLAQSFAHQLAFISEPDHEFNDFIFIACSQPLTIEQSLLNTQQSIWLEQRRVEIDQRKGIVLTDNFNPLEHLQGNKSEHYRRMMVDMIGTQFFIR